MWQWEVRVWQWEVRGVAMGGKGCGSEGGREERWTFSWTNPHITSGWLNEDSILCPRKADLNSWVILTFVYKAQLWQTGVYLYLHTKPLPLSSICSHHLLKWRRLCIILRPRLQSKLQRCDWCCTWCCLATMMFMYHIERVCCIPSLVTQPWVDYIITKRK